MNTVPAGTCELINDVCLEASRPEVQNVVKAMRQAWPDAAPHELLAQILIGRLAIGLGGGLEAANKTANGHPKATDKYWIIPRTDAAIN